MKKLFYPALLFILAICAHAQTGNTLTIRFAGVPSGTCAPFMLGINNSNGDLYDCTSGSAWNKVSGGGGGSGTVTSIATTAPITGGTITTTGTIACATCATTAAGGALTLDQVGSPAANTTFTMTGDTLNFNWGSTNTNKFIFDANGNPTFGLVSTTTAVTSSPTITLQGSYQNAGTPTFAAQTLTNQLSIAAGTNGSPTSTWSLNGSTGANNYTFTSGNSGSATTQMNIIGGGSLLAIAAASGGVVNEDTSSAFTLKGGTLNLASHFGNVGAGVFITAGTTFQASSGSTKYIGLNVANTINETSSNTSPVTDFQVNSTETALLGTPHLLADFQLGGTSKASIDKNGVYSSATVAGVSAGSFSAITAIQTTGGLVTTLTGTSDSRLKSEIKPFHSGLKAVLKLHPALYHWNPEGQKITGFPADMEQAGFIAQDVQQAIPQAVGTESHDGVDYLNLNDRPIVAALVNAIKEQQVEIETLKSRVAELEAK